MPNCAIYEKGTDTITYFIHNCIQSGQDFKGSNGSATGVKEALFDTKWTNDTSFPGDAVGSLSEALRYNDIPVSTPEDVNAITRQLIFDKYPPHSEAKLQRLQLSGKGGMEWVKYCNYLEILV